MGAKLFGFFVGVLMATTCIWGSGIFDIACASSTWSMDDILSNDIGGLGYKYVPTSYVKSSNGNSAAVLCYNDDDQKYAVK